MTVYRTGKGNAVGLGPELGRGGEGIVYRMADDAERVAKIYLQPPDRQKADKLVAMAAGCTDKLNRIAAWPMDTIHDQRSGQLVGFLMRSVARKKDIHLLYGTKSRLREYPEATYRFLVHVAANVARAFAVVHAHGHVVGDVNQGGVCVSAEGTVSLVDCDSFQTSAGPRTFSCDVGIPIYQPPELQNVTSFRGLPRTPNHDAFGLAVLIFQTLFLARHPYSGTFLGPDQIPLEQSIREFRFAYARDAARRLMKQPAFSLGLGTVPPALAMLFERAFLEEGARGRRPTAHEWIDALGELGGELKDCGRNRSHAHWQGLPQCPLCEIEGRGGTLLFLPPRAASVSGPVVNLEALWTSLQPTLSELRAGNAIARPQPVPSQALSPAIVDYHRKRGRRRMATGLLVGLGLVLLLLTAATPLALIGVVAAMVGTVLVHTRGAGDPPPEVQQLPTLFRTAEARIREVDTEMTRVRADGVFRQGARAAELYETIKQFDQRRAAALRAFEQGKQTRQMRRHLDQFEVESCGLKGLGRGLLMTLVSYGVETADDVSEHALKGIPGFGPKRIAALLEWKRAHLASFRFKPSDPADAAELQRLERDFANEYNRYLGELVTVAQHIQRDAPAVLGRMRALRGELDQAHQVRSSASDALAYLDLSP